MEECDTSIDPGVYSIKIINPLQLGYCNLVLSFDSLVKGDDYCQQSVRHMHVEKVNNPKLKLLINKYEKSNKTRSLHHGYRKHLLQVGKMAPTVKTDNRHSTFLGNVQTRNVRTLLQHQGRKNIDK